MPLEGVLGLSEIGRDRQIIPSQGKQRGQRKALGYIGEQVRKRGGGRDRGVVGEKGGDGLSGWCTVDHYRIYSAREGQRMTGGDRGVQEVTWATQEDTLMR